MIDDKAVFEVFSKLVRKYKKIFLTVLKYLFSTIVTILSFVTTGDIYFVLVSLCELTLIFWLSNILVSKNKWIGYLVNNILILLFNIEILVLCFGNSFVTLTMVMNITSWEALKGRSDVFLLGIFLLLFFSFLPIRYVSLRKIFSQRIPKFTFFINILLVFAALTPIYFISQQEFYEPLGGVYSLAKNGIDYIKILDKTHLQLDESQQQLSEKFFNKEISDFVKKPDNLPEHPNVILLFTEGLSQHIINDERNVMPNLYRIQQEALQFDNYYNHTFATYKGLIGQLYSGYQLDNSDSNYLESVQSILKMEDYKTSFLNTEPKNKEFTEYLKNFQFDNFKQGQLTENKDILSDEDAYNQLFQLLSEQSDSSPFLITMYTFGTHVGMDSFDRNYGDGSNHVLNRFFDLDNQFGRFIEKFKESEWSNNTIIIFTTDHATYVDDEYKQAFPDFSRSLGHVDKIPLFFYYKGIEPQKIDVAGRNSINLAPTILDYIDVSQPNHFLGRSLFSQADDSNVFETTFISGVDYYSTLNGNITTFSEQQLSDLETRVVDYYSASRYP
ncbi:LTA synthase family protein [Streptococcus marmotae]|uniref:LTA synthase family protein n=1 Tax=Streptococcus marmotae TaxID=1825069 RepID=UPI00082DDB80|nr:sulfatase-like hydrolase/transferase [Streptococcus marmotae]